QQKIEEALSITYNENITVTGASRTDTGVHALGQRCSFKAVNPCIPVDKIPYAINSLLPEDIAVTASEIVPDEFNPRYAAVDKTYRYTIYNGKFRNPLLTNSAWFMYYPLDVDKMKSGAKYFVGEHDFKAFQATGGSAKTTVRKINWVNVERQGDLIVFQVNGNGFLYNMVRIMAGTLVYMGCDKLDYRDCPEMILSKDRKRAGITAPPQGLCLMEIHY
ncbi:MAG: tRNA pseudouridine(38-40) synthase TruA, partial [Clostridiales bacterium]|nr:tRNA pseudouridine(38-40) synthase TruA [Clostridiales bacterium]